MDQRRTLGDLRNVRATHLVIIHDVWTGYSAHSPRRALYELRRGKRGGLSGKGWLSSRLVTEQVVDVAISVAATATFLDTLAGAPVTAGAYEPACFHTDDFPHLELVLHVHHGGIGLLFTQSQGEFHAPWGACVGGQLLTIPGEEVGRALSGLRVPLKRGTLDRMMRKTDVVER